jgi:hypothetical protein
MKRMPTSSLDLAENQGNSESRIRAVCFVAQSRRLSSESTPAWMILVTGGVDPADLRPRCFTGRAVVPF